MCLSVKRTWHTPDLGQLTVVVIHSPYPRQQWHRLRTSDHVYSRKPASSVWNCNSSHWQLLLLLPATTRVRREPHKKILTWSTILAKTHMSTTEHYIIIITVMKREGRSLYLVSTTQHFFFSCWWLALDGPPNVFFCRILGYHYAAGDIIRGWAKTHTVWLRNLQKNRFILLWTQ